MTIPANTESRKRTLDDRRSSYDMSSDSETDNEEAFDLTNDISNPSSSNQTPTLSNAKSTDNETLKFFEEAGLSEEMLIQLGIDPEEIRAQRQLEKRSEQDRCDRELAIQLQRDLYTSIEPSSSAAQPSPSPVQPVPARPAQTAPVSAPLPPPRNIPVAAHAPPPKYNPVAAKAPPPKYNPVAANPPQPQYRALPQNLQDLQDQYMKAADEVTRELQMQPFSQNIRQIHKQYLDALRNLSNATGLHAAKRQRVAGPSTHASSSSSAQASSSSSAHASSSSSAHASASLSTRASSSATIEIESDDDDIIDLTEDLDNVTVPQIFGQVPSCSDHASMLYNSFTSYRARSYEDSSDDEDDDEDMGFDGFPAPYTIESGPNGPIIKRNGVPMFNQDHDVPFSQFQRRMTTQESEKELRELLENIQYDEAPPPEDRTGTPDRLSINLMEHQKVGLQWLKRMEESTNKGGILADDMGLGKTVQTMALMVARPCEDATPIRNLPMMRKAKRRADQDPIKAKATLIVCPIALIAQWEREIQTKTNPPLTVIAHYGANRVSDETTLASFDVVITAYSTVANECAEDFIDRGPLGRLKFHRVVLDEGHQIKNKNTKAALACCRVDADYRWCLTATPIQNKIGELYSLIKFLRIRPYCEWDIFREEIEKPLKNDDTRPVIRRVQALLKAISLRRSKKAKIDGRPILDLPERNVHFTHVDFSPEERQFYDFVNKKCQARFNKYMSQGTVMKNYSSVLVLLLRLRQACLHPRLTTLERSQEPALDENAQETLAHAMDMTVVNRLLHDDNDFSQIECPICMDMADQPQIIPGCGHMLCRECLENYLNCNTHTSEKRCPQCRGDLSQDKVVSIEVFLKVHAPDLYDTFIAEKEAVTEEEAAAQERVEALPSSSKIDKMLEVLHETRRQTKNKDKTIVFSQFTAFLDIVEQPLKDHEFNFVRYDGSMSLRRREEVLHMFMTNPKYTVLLVSTKCGSLGLNLTVANRVILMDIWWNPALENQAIDRVHRIGQRKAVEVHRIFINDTVEDRILDLQKKKQDLADGALGEGSGHKLGRLGLQELLHLFRGTGA